jgi:MAM domain, meprin/A5/mu
MQIIHRRLRLDTSQWPLKTTLGEHDEGSAVLIRLLFFFRSNRLRSRPYNNVGDECFRFWYFVNGPDGSTGKLSVAKQNTNSPTETNLWSSDIYENAWRYRQVSINGGANSFSAVFQASKSSTDVVIGVDDVILTLGYCPPPINCDFEQADLCSWTQMKDDDFDWLLQQGETDSFGTGPTVGKRSMKD